MTSLQEFRCEICGTITSSPNHWFVIRCSDSQLTVLRWNSEAANAGEARHFCGEARAQVYIRREVRDQFTTSSKCMCHSRTQRLSQSLSMPAPTRTAMLHCPASMRSLPRAPVESSGWNYQSRSERVHRSCSESSRHQREIGSMRNPHCAQGGQRQHLRDA